MYLAPFDVIRNFDRLVHDPSRLVILTALDACGASEFMPLQYVTGLSRGNLSLHLGTNGVLIRAGDCDKIARLAGSARRVYLVTVTGPTSHPEIMKAQNTRLRACAQRHANTYLIDWYKHSRGHANWFYDKMHLTPKGRKAIRGHWQRLEQVRRDVATWAEIGSGRPVPDGFFGPGPR